MDVGEISDLCNVTKSTIYVYLNKYKISLSYVEPEIRSRTLFKIKQMHKIENMKQYLYNEYINNLKSSIQIGENLGIDHRLINEWLHKFNIPLREIGENQRILNSKNMNPTSQQKQVILASWLGDGNIRKNRRTPYLRLCHGLDQYDYLIYKKEILEQNDLFSFTLYEKNDGRKPRYSLDSRSHIILNDLYTYGYKNGKACINKKYLYQLNNYGLYLWYLDDGSLQNNGRDIVLCSDGFSYNENIIIRNFLKDKFNINSNIQKVKRPENHYNYRIRLNKRETEKFINTIDKFKNEVPTMKYKFPDNIKEDK